MKKIIYSILTVIVIGVVVSLSSCTRDYDDPKEPAWKWPEDMVATISIKDLKALYVADSPTTITTDEVIVGQIISDDRQGNIYRTMYVDDGTAGIEIKIGKSGLYTFYSQGRWVEIHVKDLTLGTSNGMITLGAADPTGEYQNSYIDSQKFIDDRFILSPPETIEKPDPIEITSLSELTKDMESRLVTIKGARYSRLNACTFYDENNTRISVDTLTTWALPGYPDNPGLYIPKASASQEFTFGSGTLIVRSSGYSKFAAEPVTRRAPIGISVDITAIYTTYNGTRQLVLNDVRDVVRQ